VTGFGYLSPTYPNVSILVSFVKPDGSVIDLQVAASKKGAFNFTYTPDAIGDWAVAPQWQSDKSYCTFAYSEHTFMEVTATPENKLPTEYIYAVIIV
jgi:hypothetical protein